MEELRQYRQQASVAKDSLKKIETTPRPNQPQRKDSVELDDYEIEYTSYDNDPENELNSHAAPSSSIKTPQQAQPPAPLSNVVNPSKAKFRSSDLIAPEPLVSLPPKSTTRRTAPPSKLEKFVKSRLPSRMTSASSTTRKRINSLDTISATDKPKKQKKNDLSILKDFHFQPEVSQTDIEKALPPGTSSYLTPASRIPTEAKTNTISTPTTIATPTSTVTPTATTTTTAPPIKNINNVPVTHSSTPLGITPQANAFKAPFAVPKPANPLPATPIEELLEQRSNNSGNNLTVANAINPIELRAIIDSSIKKSPTFIVSRLGDTSEFKIEVIDGALSAVESILQGLKTHGNPILKQDSFPLQRTVYGSVNEFRFESPVCFDNKEKALACLLIGLISICPDHESAYQYITKWIFGKAFRLTKDGKINLACRYTRILSLICRNIDDIQRLRVFCYDIIRFSPVTTNFVGILLNVAVVWPEVLFTGSHDFSQVGEEVIPKILQSTTAAYCKHHDALEAAKSTYVVLAQLCNWVPLSSSLSLEQCCTELSKALNLELLKQLMRSCPEAFYDLAFNLKQAYAILFRRIEDSNTLNSFVVNTLDPNLNDPKIGLFYAEIKGILQHQRNTAEN
ncbi:hypothetical protein J3Q64DRAFT_1725265 [Phycomyces blakesleeanus]|uniref:Uncharacterized protein n=1 Tax=Phycomyces blakesleeanus TaxID=4837 RepID=A0ABR3B6U6_PHYBL